MLPANQLTLRESQLRVLRALVRNKVSFLVIGGQAIACYTAKRTTNDLDILLSRSNSNARRVEHALEASKWRSSHGLPLHQMLTKENKLIEYPDAKELKEVDLLSSIDGIDFNKIYQRSKIAIINNLPVHIPSVADLIFMKEISAKSSNSKSKKEQDLIDISDLMSLVD